MSLHTFFLYFGSKSQLARYYPPPQHDTIIEPFAGSAAYSVRYHHKRVVLVDKDPVVVGIWRFLLASSPRDILSLPELEADQVVEDLDCCQEARWLIGRWINYGSRAPAHKRTPWAANQPDHSWGRTIRARLASQIDKIRHWTVLEGDYFEAPELAATWFIDPPYKRAGVKYTMSSADIDFQHLAAWCRTRAGQVMVCEEQGADWLPFGPFRTMRSVGGGSRIETHEVIWTNDGNPEEARAAG